MEQLPRRYTRFDNIQTALQYSARRRKARQIDLIREALRREGSTKSTEQSVLPSERENVSYDELQMALFKVFIEISQKAEHGTNPFRAIEAAELMNERIGSLLTDQTPIESLIIPKIGELRKLTNNPNYDQAVIHQMLETPQAFRVAYNFGLKLLTHQNKTVGDLRRKSYRKLAEQRSVTFDKAIFAQIAFKPR